jgi:hypothetical protein
MLSLSVELMEDYAIEEFLAGCKWAAEKQQMVKKGEQMATKKKTAKKSVTKKSK